VTIDHFLGGLSRSDLAMPKPPDIDVEFKQTIERATALAESGSSARRSTSRRCSTWGRRTR
jgi:hypothetical protein